ncbi:branched-chain amino acid transport system ATP-binding protein [Ancylobacter sp. 3268]|uniref:ABC transporter ATP-binding protein n=1 Tax=Ancylobacter sp. 3268 TaxID=2817752 RepID=UPI0028640E2C|nr:ABC transporter ATP-binding protein [Ancylobacter sp. 3268]MDR6952620.1 branched-chain amino acid transport system ATP-binding protein [Ancylobacter sp. 3268]
MTTGTPVLQLQGLVKHYGRLRVSDDVWLDVAPGETHALIGPNGAGKTTLIGQIAGEIGPDSGRILIDGKDVTGEKPHRRVHRGLARSFQITRLINGFSALENVALCAQALAGSSFRFLTPASRDEGLNAIARSALEEVGLAERADVLAGGLSHGEKRQWELAMALVARPKLMVLDEPMAGLGKAETQRMIDVLRRLARHAAILLVEHDMHAVFALADRISVLVEGRIVASGSPETIRADTAVRAAYLGEEA